MYDVIIVGCGITGAATAFALSKYKLSVLVLEKENDIAMGATRANSAIIHAGYDPEPGTLMARLNVKGCEMAAELCEKLDVPYKNCGSLVLAFDENDVKTLHVLYERGLQNGVKRLELIDRCRLKELEPNVSDQAVAALYAPTSGIVNPWEYALAMAEGQDKILYAAGDSRERLAKLPAVTGAVKRGYDVLLCTQDVDEFMFQAMRTYHMDAVAGDAEPVALNYVSHLNDATMEQALAATRERDLVLGYTSRGPHRDDIELTLGTHPMRNTGSQGQCKTYTIALRLAQYDFLRRHVPTTPILLLDDIFDKLDARRVEHIVDVVSSERFGQIFITDTNRTHLDEIMARQAGEHTMFIVENGTCVPAH